MRVDDFDYTLPEELIAQKPLENRDLCKMLTVDRKSGETRSLQFRDIKKILKRGDLLVVNETKVIPARFYAKREDNPNSSTVEIFLIKEISLNKWEVLVKPGRRAKVGHSFIFGDDIKGKIVEVLESGNRILYFDYNEDIKYNLFTIGNIPLPPYIKRESNERDISDYQTVFAQKEGAVAAPTAGLHFTRSLLEEIESIGVEIVKIVLHVGIGTFRPVKVDTVEEHEMHNESYEIEVDAAERINKAIDEKRRIIAVGTTSVRTLESGAIGNKVVSGKGNTKIFIYPGYNFKIINGLITNFHLPKSTLIMLVSAFAGRENIMNAYKRAVEEKYRFFSYGDAMLII
ncbi:MAG: tRNA preQ1(34) S-adenosylmethionine ribosyltransferase-isomerase QueA [Candidatus Cloacimonadota bacterium]|nr:MAG: tRNA preQ1(34) S-adenosylmethionine ribosyltransferase-isomerase QueA [Candidatus Cloacimonadota bacterium]PIE80627.1 MAG: tRNA preQ1(34) S-adenosylmethionine ribosyltransferase-isomerase QueA [Candidatus Delongbacteria bacterium]